ncbi:MAG: enoyl-CoA hydratase/isomerase family protein [Planctomycetota bacterium]
MAEETIFAGGGGYAKLTRAESGSRKGAVLEISNPNSKVNTLPPEALTEIGEALDAVDADGSLEFLVLCGGEGKVHAGADVNTFAGEVEPPEGEKGIDLAAVEAYLKQGAALDVRIKKISKKLTTASAMSGERFGGSVEWPLMTTYCVAAEGTGIQLSEVTIGIIPGWDGVLNVALRSGPASALYMGATGARVDDAQMLESGIVDAVVPESEIVAKALEIAGSAPPERAAAERKELASEEEILAALKDRLDTSRYEALRDNVAEEKEEGGDPKELSKSVEERLAQMGKPCAPLAVEAVSAFVKDCQEADLGDVAAFETLAFKEAALCTALMKTADRVMGINSILKAREDVLNKIPIYTKS